MSEGEDDKDVDRRVQIMTTMHFALAGERASTVTEAVGRAAMYLTTVSMALIALGFISSATNMGDAFYAFAFVLLLCLFLLGIVSFRRVVQTGVQDLRLLRDEARIREFYVDVSPGVDRWFNHRVTDEAAKRMIDKGGGSRSQMLLTAGSMIGGVNSAVIAVVVGLALVRFGGASLLGATLTGAAVFVVAGGLHLRTQYMLFATLDRRAATPASPNTGGGTRV